MALPDASYEAPSPAYALQTGLSHPQGYAYFNNMEDLLFK